MSEDHVGDILIRGVSGTTHEELKRRADAAGTSLQSYVRDLLDAHTARPSLREWLADLEHLDRHPEISGADAVRGAREDLR